MLRGFLLISLLLTIAAVAVLGFRGEKTTNEPWEIFPDMVRQMKVRAQAPLDFFADGRGPRLPVAGTVPIGYEMPTPNAVGGDAGPAKSPASATRAADVGSWSHPNVSFSEGTDYYNTGKMGADQWGTGIPVEVTPQLMERGQQRFNITCAMCHGATAAGDGITKKYGLTTVVSLQDERIRKMSDGEIFNTITHGKNTMLAYGPTVIVADRWAIISYLRALQRSQNATAADVPPDHQADLEKPAENKPPQASPAAPQPAKK
jgi:mono/diheme cytochrome c family protein